MVALLWAENEILSDSGEVTVLASGAGAICSTKDSSLINKVRDWCRSNGWS